MITLVGCSDQVMHSICNQSEDISRLEVPLQNMNGILVEKDTNKQQGIIVLDENGLAWICDIFPSSTIRRCMVVNSSERLW